MITERTRNSFFEIYPEWGVSKKAKKLGLDPLKLSLSWVEQTGRMTPELCEAYKATKTSSQFGSLFGLPLKVVKLTRRVHNLLFSLPFKPLTFAQEAIETGGKTVQLAGTLAGLVKLAEQVSLIELTGVQEAFLSTVVGWGVAASIGFGIKNVCRGISRLSENRLNDPNLSPESFRLAARKFTIDLLKLVGSVCLVAIQLFSLIALITMPAPTLVVLLFSTAGLLARISAEFYLRIHAPDQVKTLRI